MLTRTFTVRSLAVEWVQFTRANTVSPGYMATEISDFVPAKTKNMWKDKIPMGYVVSQCMVMSHANTYPAVVRVRPPSSREPSCT